MNATTLKDHPSTTDRILEVLRRLGCDADEIHPVHELDHDLGIDSTEVVELAILVRREFGVDEHAISLAGARTVADVIRRVDACFAGRPA